MNDDLRRHLAELAASTPQYAPEAYLAVLESLNRTAEWVKKGVIRPQDAGDRAAEKNGFHVSGRELLEGFRRHMLDQYGGMARFLLRRWGLNRTEDVGAIVFNLVERGELRRRECDTMDDFANGYDFDEAFQKDPAAG